MRPLFAVLAVQLVLATIFLVLVATGSLPFTGDDNGNAAAAKVNHFDGPAAFNLLKLQLSYGPRPAGSKQSRKLAVKLRSLLPDGRFQDASAGSGLDFAGYGMGVAVGDINNDGWADVVISNGVVNLCPDKHAVFREMFRILKPGGRIQIGDILVHKEVPQSAKDDIALWSG